MPGMPEICLFGQRQINSPWRPSLSMKKSLPQRSSKRAVRCLQLDSECGKAGAHERRLARRVSVSKILYVRYTAKPYHTRSYLG